MSRKQCRRKVYRLVNPIEHAINGASLLTAGQLDGLKKKELDAIEAFRTGSADPYDFQTLADMMNVAEYMAKSGIGPEVIPVAYQASMFLKETAVRRERTGRWGMTGPALECMRQLHEWHYLQRTALTGSDYKRIVKATSDRIKAMEPDVCVIETYLEAQRA